MTLLRTHSQKFHHCNLTLSRIIFTTSNATIMTLRLTGHALFSAEQSHYRAATERKKVSCPHDSICKGSQPVHATRFFSIWKSRHENSEVRVSARPPAEPSPVSQGQYLAMGHSNFQIIICYRHFIGKGTSKCLSYYIRSNILTPRSCRQAFTTTRRPTGHRAPAFRLS